MDALGQLVLHAAGSPLLLPLVFVLVVIDAISLDHRVSSAVLAGRFVPGGRVGVSLVAGASRIRRSIFRPLTLLSAACWTVYLLIIGAVAGSWVGQHPALAALAATGLGLLIGFVIDTTFAAIRRRRHRGRAVSARRPGSRDRQQPARAAFLNLHDQRLSGHPAAADRRSPAMDDPQLRARAPPFDKLRTARGDCGMIAGWTSALVV